MTWYSVILSRSFVPPLLPKITDEFKLTYAESGFIITSLLIGYAIMLFLGGWLAGRMERRRIIVPGLIIMAFASFLISYSADYWQLVAFQFIMGLGAGCYLNPANSILSEVFTQKERGLAFGIHETAVSLGTFSATIIAPLIAVRSGWRAPFLISTVTLPISALLFWRMGREPRGIGARVVGPSMSMARVLTPRFLLMCLAYALGVGFCFNAFLTFLPTYLGKVFGLEFIQANLLVSVVYLSGALGRLTGGPISDRLNRRRVSILWLAIVSSSIFLLTRMSTPDIPLTSILIAAGYALNGLIPIMFAFLADTMPPPLRGVGFGFMTSMAVTSGALSGFVIGYIADVAGFVTAFTFLALFEASSTILLLAAR